MNDLMTERYFVGMIARGISKCEEWVSNHSKFQEQIKSIEDIEQLSFCVYMGVVQYFRIRSANSNNKEIQDYICKLYGYTLKNGYAVEYIGVSTESIPSTYFEVFFKYVQRLSKDRFKMELLYSVLKSWELLDKQHIKILQCSSGLYRFDEWYDINMQIEGQLVPYINKVRLYVDTNKLDAYIDLLNYAAYVGKLKVFLVRQKGEWG